MYFPRSKNRFEVPHRDDGFVLTREYAKSLSDLSTYLYNSKNKGEIRDVCDFYLSDELLQQSVFLDLVMCELEKHDKRQDEKRARKEMYRILENGETHDQLQFHFDRWCNILDQLPVVVPSICCNNLMDIDYPRLYNEPLVKDHRRKDTYYPEGKGRWDESDVDDHKYYDELLETIAVHEEFSCTIESLQYLVVEIANECDLEIVKFSNHISPLLPEDALHDSHPVLHCKWEYLMKPFDTFKKNRTNGEQNDNDNKKPNDLLAAYYKDDFDINGFIKNIEACKNNKQLKIIVSGSKDKLNLQFTKTDLSTPEYIEALRPHIKYEKGISLTNLQEQIRNACL